MADALEKLHNLLGDKGVLTGDTETAAYYREWRGRYSGNGMAVLRPANTQEVAAAVKICAAHKTPIVPQGGNTGLVGASVPIDMPGAVVLSTDRMTTIRETDPDNDSLTAEAGCILADIQQQAEIHDRLFPLRLAAEGSCRIGGNIATNAGGMQALRYGVMRDLVLGIEAVLPDGSVWNGLSKLRKDNTGYDLKHLFIGSEGTLGIITAASLKLFARPRAVETVFAAVKNPAAAVALLNRLKSETGESVSVFEMMARRCIDFATAHIPDVKDPLSGRHDWYIMAELSGGATQTGLRDALEAVLAEAMYSGDLPDAVLASSATQRAEIWKLRESFSEAQRGAGGSIKHDIAVPVSALPAFLDEALAAVETAMPGVRPAPFGHAGDGNLHFNLSQPENMEKDAFLARWDEMNRIVHDIVIRHGGTISAEHGIGHFKTAELSRTKDTAALDMMRRIKSAIDPDNIMNPGRMLG